MTVGNYYIVDFNDAIELFERQMGRGDLPVIDLDPVKWQVMEMFNHVEPLIHLERIVGTMLQHDWLYRKVEFVYTTPMKAKQKKIEMNHYLHSCIMGLGHNLYQRLKEVGLLPTGTERYKVTIRPLDNETYTLRRTR